MQLRMKQWSRAAWTAIVSAFTMTSLALAQDAGTAGAVTTTRTTEVWYGNWWVWAIGIAVFLIIVIALTNRGGRSSI